MAPLNAPAHAAPRAAPQVCQAVQGLSHPDTAACLGQLVALLRGANKAANALPLAQRLLSVKRQVRARLGPRSFVRFKSFCERPFCVAVPVSGRLREAGRACRPRRTSSRLLAFCRTDRFAL